MEYSNKFIEKARTAMRTYQQRSSEVHAKLEAGKKTYQPDVYEALEKDEYGKLSKDYEKAMMVLDNMGEELPKKVLNWGILKGSDVNQQDMCLLNGNFELKPKDIYELKQKYLNNYTMLQAVQNYAMNNKMDIHPIDPESRAVAYKRFADAGVDVLKIITSAPDDATTDAAIELFGPQDNLYRDLLGTGEELN